MRITYFLFKSCVDITDVREDLNPPYVQMIKCFISLLNLKRLNPSLLSIAPFEKNTSSSIKDSRVLCYKILCAKAFKPKSLYSMINNRLEIMGINRRPSYLPKTIVSFSSNFKGCI